MDTFIGKSFDVLGDGLSLVKLVNMMPNNFLNNPNAADLAVVQAARVSYDKGLGETDRDKRLIRYLMDNEHTSPFEMVEYIFEVQCPLPIAAQWMRHRTGSYNQVSRRYTEEGIQFYAPEQLRWQDDKNKQASTYGTANIFMEDWHEVYSLALAKYHKFLDAGISREQARFILPQGLYTKFLFKVDLHNLLQFIRKRASKESQWEMQMFAACIYEEFVKPTVSWTAEAFERSKYETRIVHKNHALKLMKKTDENNYVIFLHGKHHSAPTIDQLLEALADRYIMVNYVEKE